MQISVIAAPNSHFSFQVSELHKHRNLILRHKPDPTQLQHRSVISRFLFLPLLSSLEEKCKHKKYTMQAASHKNNSNNRSGEYAHWVQSCVILPFFLSSMEVHFVHILSMWARKLSRNLTVTADSKSLKDHLLCAQLHLYSSHSTL